MSKLTIASLIADMDVPEEVRDVEDAVSDLHHCADYAFRWDASQAEKRILDAIFALLLALKRERAKLRATYFHAPYLAEREVCFDEWAYERWISQLADWANGTGLDETVHDALVLKEPQP